MSHARDPKLAALSNHDLGARFAMQADAIDAGRSFANPQDLFALKRLLWEAAARLHRNWPGEPVQDTKETLTTSPRGMPDGRG